MLKIDFSGNGNISELRITSNTRLGGYVRFNNGEPVIDENGPKSIHIKFDNPISFNEDEVSLSESPYLLIPLPSGSYDHLSIEFINSSGNSAYVQTKENIHVEDNHMYLLHFDTDSFEESAFPYVDLGLSVNWATYNVGATSPEEFGSYFAWGETTEKDFYSWSTYKYCNGDNQSLTKYCDVSFNGYNGFKDNITRLEPSDDAATVNFGAPWRTPTTDEFNELLDNCSWVLTNINGTDGYIVTSTVPGYTDRSIFLPLPGVRYDSYFMDQGSYGCYWTSSIRLGNPIYSVVFTFHPNNTWYSHRYRGMPVRAVRPKH